MSGSKACSFWVVSLETTLSTNLSHFFVICVAALIFTYATLLVAHLVKSRSLRLEWQTLSYLSLLCLHGVLSHSSPAWIKSFNLPVPSYTHTLPWRTTYFLPYYNVYDLRLLNFCPFFKCQLGSHLLCETFLEHFRTQIFHFPELL